METDPRYRRHDLYRWLGGEPDGSRHSADSEGDRHWHPPEPLGGRRTSVPNDFFSQMRTVFSLQKREVWERRHAGDKNPPAFLTVRDVLEFATIEGARANGLDRKIGTPTPGKEADIILLRADRFNVMPVNNAVGAVVEQHGPAERRHRAHRRQDHEARRPDVGSRFRPARAPR